MSDFFAAATNTESATKLTPELLDETLQQIKDMDALYWHEPKWFIPLYAKEFFDV